MSTTTTSSGETVRSWLYERFRGRAHPLVATATAVRPAASLWAASRRLIGELRSVLDDERAAIALDLAPGPEFVEALVACWWELRACVLVRPGMDDRPNCWRIASVEGRLQLIPPMNEEIEHLRAEPGTAAIFDSTGGPGSTSVRFAELDRVQLDAEGTWLLSLSDWTRPAGFLGELVPALATGFEILRPVAEVQGSDHARQLIAEWRPERVGLAEASLLAGPAGRAALPLTAAIYLLENPTSPQTR